MNSPLVSAAWLYEHSEEPNLVILDASIEFQIPTETDKDTENLIPGSQRFDYDKIICDQSSPLPHMMPTDAEFNQRVQALGINQDSIIVVYDNSGTFASPRAYWMFKAMGHQQVYILDGGLTEWKFCGYPVVQSYEVAEQLGDFTGVLNPSYFVDADFVERHIGNTSSLTIDARGLARFLAQVPEPRQGVRSGHIPNSVCLPFATLMDGHRVKPVEALNDVVKAVLGEQHSQYIFSCGSGVTACIIALAAELCGYNNLSVYDGSWTEWGQDTNRPISID